MARINIPEAIKKMPLKKAFAVIMTAVTLAVIGLSGATIGVLLYFQQRIADTRNIIWDTDIKEITDIVSGSEYIYEQTDFSINENGIGVLVENYNVNDDDYSIAYEIIPNGQQVYEPEPLSKLSRYYEMIKSDITEDLPMAYSSYVVSIRSDRVKYSELDTGNAIAYMLLSVCMVLLPVVYTMTGVWICYTVIYNKKLKAPIQMLKSGVDNISQNNLDFSIHADSPDEIGELCSAVESMKNQLYQNNIDTWRRMEESRALNVSISHDLRTPITVIKGYLDFLKINIPKDRLTQDKVIDTLYYISDAVERLENYVECVRDIQKLEEIELYKESEDFSILAAELESDFKLLANGHNKQFIMRNELTQYLYLDKKILFRILENVINNALAYARSEVCMDCVCEKEELVITVTDDGGGFSDETIRNATKLFFKTEDDNHFGMGLFISRILCEKHGGRLLLMNSKDGGGQVKIYLNLR